MKGCSLKGEKYRKAMAEWVPRLKAEAGQMIASGGTLTPLTVSQMAVKHDLPIKTTFQFLEHGEVLPTGTWDRLASRGFTAKQAREAVKTAASPPQRHLRVGQ